MVITTGTLLVVLAVYLLLIRPVRPARVLFGSRPASPPPASRPRTDPGRVSAR